MSLVEINWTPSNRQLREFAALSLIAVPAIGWLWGTNLQGIAILALIATVWAAVGWFQPILIRPVFVGLAIVATPLGMIISELAMIFIFFVVFLPISLMFKLMHRDALKLKMDRNCPTHWQAKHEPDDVSSYYRRY